MITYRSKNRTDSSVSPLPDPPMSRSESSFQHSQENTSSNSTLHSVSNSMGNQTVPSPAQESSEHSQSWVEADMADDPDFLALEVVEVGI